jgi:hypothetical protein
MRRRCVLPSVVGALFMTSLTLLYLFTDWTSPVYLQTVLALTRLAPSSTFSGVVVSCLRYTCTNANGTLAGDSLFNVTNTTLNQLGFPLTNISARWQHHQIGSSSSSNGGAASNDRLVFVTAVSSDRIHVDMDAIALVQKYFPYNKIYFYDLSDTPQRIVDKIRQLCNVVYRKFDYSLHPGHVRDLFTYAFKPIIIHEMFREHSRLFWLDSSIRFKSSDLASAANGSQLSMFDFSGHSIFVATHAGMYRYLPIDRQAAIAARMWGANAIYFQLTQELYDNVIRWWFLCALESDCMAPTRDLYCKFKGRDEYAQCHRYDQSALNILLANYFNYNDSSYWSGFPLLSVERGSKHKEQLYICQPDSVGGGLVRDLSKNYLV